MKLTDCDGMSVRVYRPKSVADFDDTVLMLKDHGYDEIFSTMLVEDHYALKILFGEFRRFAYLKSPLSGISSVVVYEKN